MGNAPDVHRGRDLDTAEEVELFVARFYRILAQDEAFHRCFDGIDWNAHMLTLADFWQHALFDADTYELDNDTVMERHRPLHAEQPFDTAIFERWIELLYQVLDDGWSGPKATEARRRGHGMAWAMAKRFTDSNVGRVQ